MDYIYQCSVELIIGISTIIIYITIRLLVKVYNYIIDYLKDFYKLKQDLNYQMNAINIEYCQLKYLVDYQIDYNRKHLGEIKKMINNHMNQNKKQYDELYRCIPPFNVYLGKQNNKPIYCLHNTEALKLSNNSDQIVQIETDFSKFCKLRKLFICNYYCDEIKIISETLEWLRIYNGENNFVIPNIIKTPNLKHLEFYECSDLYGHDNLLDQLINHPNKNKIELVFKESPYFDDKLEQYKKIGTIVC